MHRRTLFWVVAAAVALAAVMGLRSGDRGEIEKGLATVASAIGQGEAAARRAVESWADDRVRLDVAGDTEGLGRDELARRAAQYAREHGGVVINVTNVEVRVHDARSSVSGLLVISDSQLGDLHAEERPFAANLTHDGEWRIEDLTIGEARKHLPEARP
ncbi:MAG: hypothetical protein JW940_36230 [Polyangiaceae bacterium]|nr:hypothetical protein [Polyangiaceae bacterium]